MVNTDQCQKIVWNHLTTVVKRMWRSRQGLSIKSPNHLSFVWMLRSNHDLSVKIWNHLLVVGMAIKIETVLPDKIWNHLSVVNNYKDIEIEVHV